MEWQPVETAPKDGTRFIGAIYWPTPESKKCFANSVLNEPAGVIYNYVAETFWHNGCWHVAPLEKLIYQDSLYAWQPRNLPPIPKV